MTTIGDDENCSADSWSLVFMELVMELCSWQMTVLSSTTDDIYRPVDWSAVFRVRMIDDMINTQALDPPAR